MSLGSFSALLPALSLPVRRPAEAGECLWKRLQGPWQPQRSEPARRGPGRPPEPPLARQRPPARQTLEVKTLSVVVRSMFALLSDPCADSPVGHFQKRLQRKDQTRAIGPLPSSCFLSSPTSSSGRIFTKPRGTAGSSVLPVLYETLKSPKPSRNKSLNLFRLLIFFFF